MKLSGRCLLLLIGPGLLCGLLVVGGCSGPQAEEGGFNSANPASKLYAIRQAGEARDPAAIPRLIEQLNSDDPAVRLYAIEALERITGERLGYSPYAMPHVRNQAVDRWVEWHKRRQGEASEPADPSTGPSAAAISDEATP